MKKAPQPREVQSDPDINIQTIHKKAETERERLLALVENSNEEVQMSQGLQEWSK